jgi:hypothetical protein
MNRIKSEIRPAIDSEVSMSKPSDREIALLAYQLWEERGCPIGLPDNDWLLAERQLENPQAAVAVA